VSVDLRRAYGKGRTIRQPAGTLPRESVRSARHQRGEERALLRPQERTATAGLVARPSVEGTRDGDDSLGYTPHEREECDRPGQRLGDLLRSGDYDRSNLRRGEVREATVLSIGENDIVVDVGAKSDGIIPPGDLSLVTDDRLLAGLQVGDRVPVVVLKKLGYGDGITVSLNKGLQQQDWLRAQEFLASEELIEARVTDSNRGGVLVSFGRLHGFVPNSHLTAIGRGLRGQRLREAKSDLIGQTLSLVVIEVNQRRRRLVLSERVAQRHKRQQLLEELTEGEVRTGVVRNLVDFGAFVDLGGLDGLVHISELDWQHVDHPGDVLDVGDEVEVYVLNVDRERERVALSRKRLLPDPWNRVARELHEGEMVEGTVTNVVSFGVFVDVGGGVEGLIHSSKMPGSSDLEAGFPVTVRVLGIDQWERRIALSLVAGRENAPQGAPAERVPL
jgi:small subunit ribosomal protein S1